MSVTQQEKVINVLFTGLGGQGIIRASDMLAKAAFRMGYDVKKSELHGMSQRGGSVSADVRFGKKVWSPMIPAGEADFIVATAEDQIEVWSSMPSKNCVIIRPGLFSEEEQNSKMFNTVLLGRLNCYLKFPFELWEQLIRESFGGAVAEANVAAFKRGEKME